VAIDEEGVVISTPRKSVQFVVLFLGVATFASTRSFEPQAQVSFDEGPKYTTSGDLLMPEGFETWIFVGSNLGLSYKQNLTAMTAKEAARADPPQFHNIYINQGAYSYFLANKSFPEKTILVMEVFEADAKEPKGILSSGLFDGKRTGVEVAVKNSLRPDAKTTPWAYYDFADPSDSTKTRGTAAAFPDHACESCHHLHASVDNVWVQFYPALRDKM
jgi:hypothetical protein